MISKTPLADMSELSVGASHQPMRRQCRFRSSRGYPSARDLLQMGSFKDTSHARLPRSYTANWLTREYRDKCQREDGGNLKSGGFNFSSVRRDFTEAESAAVCWHDMNLLEYLALELCTKSNVPVCPDKTEMFSRGSNDTWLAG